MPSASDFMDKLGDIEDRLKETRDGVGTVNTTLNTKLDAINATLTTKLDAINATLTTKLDGIANTLVAGLSSLINLGNYTNQALHQNAEQNDTIICVLEHISRNTCAILTEVHVQTGLQKTIDKSSALLAELYAATHAEAMLAHEKMAKLKAQIEECCPPKPEPPACTYQPCEAPRPLRPPTPERPLRRE